LKIVSNIIFEKLKKSKTRNWGMYK
jgi:hypothetical protein